MRHDAPGAAAVAAATLSACLFGALVGTVAVIAWAAWDVSRKVRPTQPR